MGKRLNTLILSFLFTSFSSLFSQDSLKYSQQDLLIYKKVKESIEKADTLTSKTFNLPSMGLVNIYSYDFDKDRVADASEIYTLKYSASKGKLEQSENPLFYLSDYNNNGVICHKELLIDEEQDGLNGNEEFSEFLQSEERKVVKWEL